MTWWCAANLRPLEAGSSQSESVKALMESKKVIVDGALAAEGRYRATGEALENYALVLDGAQPETCGALVAARAAKADADRAGRRDELRLRAVCLVADTKNSELGDTLEFRFDFAEAVHGTVALRLRSVGKDVGTPKEALPGRGGSTACRARAGCLAGVLLANAFVVADDFLHDERQELLGKDWVEARLLGQGPQARDLLGFSRRIGGWQTVAGL